MPMRVSHRVLSAPICVPNSGSCIFPVSLNALNAPVSTNLHPEVVSIYNISHTRIICHDHSGRSWQLCPALDWFERERSSVPAAFSGLRKTAAYTEQISPKLTHAQVLMG